jgi:hypothetical protein
LPGRRYLFTQIRPGGTDRSNLMAGVYGNQGGGGDLDALAACPNGDTSALVSGSKEALITGGAGLVGATLVGRLTCGSPSHLCGAVVLFLPALLVDHAHSYLLISAPRTLTLIQVNIRIPYEGMLTRKFHDHVNCGCA